MYQHRNSTFLVTVHNPVCSESGNRERRTLTLAESLVRSTHAEQLHSRQRFIRLVPPNADGRATGQAVPAGDKDAAAIRATRSCRGSQGQDCRWRGPREDQAQ
jgi:hypothetical protein